MSKGRRPDDTIVFEDNGLSHSVPVYRFGSGSPRVLITAGLHGGEVTGQYVAFRLIASLSGLRHDPSGEILVLPRCNPSAFRRLARTSPFDELDMNRIFPGDARGTPTQALAAEIWGLAQEADYIVDLHCAGPFSAPYTLAQYEEYPHCRELAARLDIPVIVQSGGSEGQLFVEAGARGTAAVIIELPGGGPEGILDLSVADDTEAALRRMLQSLDVLDGDVPAPNPRFLGPLERITASTEGLYLPQRVPGEVLARGESPGLLDDEPLEACPAGYLIMNRPPGYVFPGSSLAAVAPLVESP